MQMKKNFLAVAVFLLIAGFCFGQQRGRNFGTPEENAKRTSERLEKELGLSADQKDSVYAYTLEQGKSMQQLFQENQTGDRQQLMGKMRDLREKTDKKILSVLNADQQKAYEKMAEERANRMRGNGGNGGRRGGENR